jgi:DNA repair protein RecN (Recombination protein N)
VLSQLSIQGLAIIDALTIDFTSGFNVITGETGAGKSILIKALGLLLGAKASPETVRRGRDAATVSGTFEVPPSHRCLGVLEQYGIPVEAEGKGAAARCPLLVRRTVNAKGRSLAWINDVPVTAHVLREFAGSLIDVFGQHENLKLLEPSQHVEYIDLFLKDKALATSYRATWESAQQQVHALTELIDAVRSRRRDADYLAFRCDELRKFAPTREDFDELNALCQRSTHMLTLAGGIEKAQACLDGGGDGEPLSRPLWEVGKILARLEPFSADLAPLAAEASALASRVDDLSFQVGKAASGLDVDENDLEAAQSRIAGYQELFRKLAVPDVDALAAEQARLEADLQSLESSAVEVEDRLKALGKTCVLLTEQAAKLSKARGVATAAIKKRIELELHELAMPGATMGVELLPVTRAIPALDVALFGDEAVRLWGFAAEALTALGEQGAERAQLMLSANKGEALLPLQKIASGGEVSRIMLALKKALAAGGDTSILVFDEIDTGISGRVADVVGRKLRELGDSFQVICISHLAQVAAYAEMHFLVHKFGKGERTESTITPLSAKDSEKEIARLLSGDEVTKTSLANARALIDKARKPALSP